MSDFHETHVCRDCGAEITLPYARALAARTADRPSLREAAEAFIAHLDSAPKNGWPDNDPAMLSWAATEYRLQEAIRAALRQALEGEDR